MKMYWQFNGSVSFDIRIPIKKTFLLYKLLAQKYTKSCVLDTIKMFCR